MVRMQAMQQLPSMLLISPGRGRLYPFAYAGGIERLARTYVETQAELNAFASGTFAQDSSYFVVVYPHSDSELTTWVDSIETRIGPITPVFHVGSSIIDAILHYFNPIHNRTNEAWVYRHDPVATGRLNPETR